MSNRRRPRPHAEHSLRQRLAQSAGQGLVDPPRIPDHDIPEVFKEQSVLSVDAAARGDVRSALEHYRKAGAVKPGMVAELHMVELLDLGDDAPGWAWSRWIRSMAYRWLLMTAHQASDVGVIATLDALYPHLDPGAMDPDVVREMGTGLGASNTLAADLAVHEFGGLHEFLLQKATPELLDRCDAVRRWGHAPMCAYRLVGTRGAHLLVRDLCDDSEVELLNLGALTDHDRHDHVLGRVVPTQARPGRMFAHRPFSIDAETARNIGRLGKTGTLEWLDELRSGVMAGRVDHMEFWNVSTPLTSDLIYQEFHESDSFVRGDDPDEWPGRKRDLVAAGVPPNVAEGILVCEFGLIAFAVSGDAASVAASHVATVLTQSVVFEAALEHACPPGSADGWAGLAELVPEPARSRCLVLSDRAREAA